MKKKLLLIAACLMALNAPVQAKMSHKTKTIASSIVAGLGLIGMGISAKYCHDSAQNLENDELSKQERKQAHKTFANSQSALVATSLITLGASTYAITQGLAWKKENRTIKKTLKLFPKKMRKVSRKQRKALIGKLKEYRKKLRRLKKSDNEEDKELYEELKNNPKGISNMGLFKKPMNKFLTKDFDSIRDDEWVLLQYPSYVFNIQDDDDIFAMLEAVEEDEEEDEEEEDDEG